MERLHLDMGRAVSCAILYAAVALAPGLSHADTAFPDRPVRIVVPFAPGGTDLTARAIAEKLSERWRQPVLVETRPGGSAQIGTAFVAKAAPDGYTLLFTANPHTVNPSLFATLPYDTRKDFVPVTLVSSGPQVLAVHPSLPVRSVRELIAYAKANPGKLNYGSSGSGGPQHMAGELFKSMAGIEMVHVPFKGGGPATLALLGGQVPVGFPNASTAHALVQRGELRALAVTSDRRAPSYPDLPTVAEAGGLDGFNVATWYGVLAPAGTPPDIVRTIRTEIARALETPEARKRLADGGAVVIASTPEAFAQFIDDEMTKYGALIKTAGIRLD